MPTTPVAFPTGTVLDVVAVGGTLSVMLSSAASVAVSGGTIFSKLTYDGLGVPVVVTGGSVALSFNPSDIKIGNVVPLMEIRATHGARWSTLRTPTRFIGRIRAPGS
jgi:hypothetical protein